MGSIEQVRVVDEYSRALSTGSRKRANAQAWVVPGDGQIFINGQSLTKYFSDIPHRAKLVLPFEVSKTLGMFNVWGTVQGGGPTGKK
jgi:small subunit ribosomal protein S9